MQAGTISAQELSYKGVMDAEGRDIGELYNLIVDAMTGILTELVVKPASGLDTRGFKKEDEYIIIPIEAVKSIKDVIILDGKKMRERA
ncbi:PRC-barrel domain containing protein [Methanophagales archaeon]|nr:MAG: PRC-barrel domain containing protein [Methanophagales archaeon]